MVWSGFRSFEDCGNFPISVFAFLVLFVASIPTEFFGAIRRDGKRHDGHSGYWRLDDAGADVLSRSVQQQVESVDLNALAESGNLEAP